MPKYSTTLRNARQDAITTAIGTSGKLKIYEGTVPANPAASRAANTLLADLDLSSTFAAAASSGVLTANSIATENPVATGTASFADLTTSGGTVVAQLTVGVGTGELQLGSLSLDTGVPVNVTALTITEGNA